MNNITFYTACKADRKPVHNQSTYKIICGSVEYDQSTKDQLLSEGFLLDETGKNISEKNWTFADAANIYYAWQNHNFNHEFVGVNQYKRYWLLDPNFTPCKNTLYVPEILHLPMNLIHHIKINRERLPQHGVATDTYISLFDSMLPPCMRDALFYSNKYVAHNMFFADTPTFNFFTQTLFDILNEVYRKCKYRIPRNDNYHCRQMGFISEIIIDGLIKNRDYFFGNHFGVEYMKAHV